jgi:predicted DNA-binding protein YlxM (UPF0122 family)
VRNLSYLNDFSFTEEASGQSKSQSSGEKTINRTHGIIVNALAKILIEKGYSVANDRNRDLFTFSNNTIENLFEIKTNSDTQSLCTALGQLLVYSIPINKAVNLIMVLPTKLNIKVEARLSNLGVKIIYFNWDNDKPTFQDITGKIK